MHMHRYVGSNSAGSRAAHAATALKALEARKASVIVGIIGKLARRRSALPEEGRRSGGKGRRDYECNHGDRDCRGKQRACSGCYKLAGMRNLMASRTGILLLGRRAAVSGYGTICRENLRDPKEQRRSMDMSIEYNSLKQDG